MAARTVLWSFVPTIPMTKPVCCGKYATPYLRTYGQHSREEGFRCRRCGQVRLPGPLPPNFDPAAWEAGLDRLRAEGIQFDGSFAK